MRKAGTLQEGNDFGVPMYQVKTLTADGQVKGGSGMIHTVTFSQNDAAPTAGSIIIYDSLTEAGDIILTHTQTTAAFMPTTITLDVACYNGIYVGFTTTADVNVTVSYL